MFRHWKLAQSSSTRSTRYLVSPQPKVALSALLLVLQLL
jgi:hypothetical protein